MLLLTGLWSSIKSAARRIWSLWQALLKVRNETLPNWVAKKLGVDP